MQIIDADSHLSEFPDLYREHTDAANRELAFGFAKDDLGYDCITYKGELLTEVFLQVPGDRATQGVFAESRRSGKPAPYSVFDRMPEHYWNPAARRDFLDQWGADAAILFPNWALNWEHLMRGEVEGLKVNTSAWNRWVVTVQSEGKGKLFPVGHLVLEDLDFAEEQLRLLAAGGVKLVKISQGLAGGKRLSHPDFERLWSLMEDLDIAVAFHIAATYNPAFDDAWIADDPNPAAPLLSFVTMAMDLQLVLADLILHGVLERHPRLRIGVMELMVDWVEVFLKRLDNAPRAHETFGGRALHTLAELPSEYFRRQVRVGAFAGERPGEICDRVGPVLMMGGDYPHSEGEPDINAYRAKAGPIDEAFTEAFYGSNARLLIGGG